MERIERVRIERVRIENEYMLAKEAESRTLSEAEAEEQRLAEEKVEYERRTIEEPRKKGKERERLASLREDKARKDEADRIKREQAEQHRKESDRRISLLKRIQKAQKRRDQQPQIGAWMASTSAEDQHLKATEPENITELGDLEEFCQSIERLWERETGCNPDVEILWVLMSVAVSSKRRTCGSKSSKILLDKYNGFLYDDTSNSDFERRQISYEKVKIAVLDTRAAHSVRYGTPDTIRKSDDDGHGTQVASIILKVTPFARLFVYRIVRRRTDSIRPRIVAAAIQDAVSAGVDIIKLSFGWDQESGDGHEPLRAALRMCDEHDILVFAATSNDGLGSASGMAYPARDDRVIAIDAASAAGKWLPFNPSRDNDFKTHRFTALGQSITTDFPPHLKSKEGWKLMDGTSAATPVAAGMAALILEFARQPPLGFASKVAERLKRPEAMREVLAGVVAKRLSKNGEYRHLVPTELFKSNWERDDADELYTSKGHRRRAVEWIAAIMGKKYGHAIVDPMHDRIQMEWRCTPLTDFGR
ncbi:peptidase S8/S53 domain-containing protein [Paraphoma chrysanthemicola]|nr:peptidase S8/S53 domain-containing protein [Paraphoma chrysanthemicola]